MRFNMATTKDLDLLRVLAEFRLATTPLLARRLGTSEQMIRRRCLELTQDGLIKAIPRNPGQGRGRPKLVYSLTSKGVQPLVTAKLLPASLLASQVTGENVERMAEHQLVLNWLALNTANIAKMGDQFTVRFISSTSPFHVTNAGSTILRDKVEFPDGSEIPFTPDAAICITHKTLKKSLLFFLEVDMGTETVADPKHTSNTDIRRKIIVYRTYLGRRGYKRYASQDLFNAQFTGFRLLLISATVQRCETLSRLVRALPPSNFVWVAEFSAIADKSFVEPVWAIGGHDGPKHSLLRGDGTRMVALEQLPGCCTESAHG